MEKNVNLLLITLDQKDGIGEFEKRQTRDRFRCGWCLAWLCLPVPPATSSSPRAHFPGSWVWWALFQSEPGAALYPCTCVWKEWPAWGPGHLEDPCRELGSGPTRQLWGCSPLLSPFCSQKRLAHSIAYTSYWPKGLLLVEGSEYHFDQQIPQDDQRAGIPKGLLPICLVFNYSLKKKKFLLKKATTEIIENTNLQQNVPPSFLVIKKVQIKAALR